jgi:hypothetical protein
MYQMCTGNSPARAEDVCSSNKHCLTMKHNPLDFAQVN